MIKKNARTILIVLMVMYVAAQFVMPRLGLSLVPNFDGSCYSGSFKYIEKIADGSCGAGADNFVGFPLVINFAYNTPLQQFLVLLIDSVPLVVMGIFLLRTKRR